MREPIPLLGPDYASRSREFNPQRTLNMYLAMGRPGSKTPLALYSCPGLSLHAQVSASGCRSNGVVFGDALYFVFGNKLVELDGTGNYTERGTLNTAGGRVEMVPGRTDLLIVDGTNGYTWDGTTFAQIGDADFPNGATHCAYLDGFFIANKPGSDQFYISASEDPTDWNALDFATAAAAPDDVLALAANFQNLYLIGSRTTQAYYNSGNVDFPFEPYPGGTMEVGIQAPNSLVRSAAGLFWLATSPEGGVFVVQVDGLSYRVISRDIAWDLTSLGVTSDATATVYQIDHRTVYQLTFPTEDRTFEFYVEDGYWIERASEGIGRYRGAGMAFFGDSYYVGDYINGQVYELDFSQYTENGAVLERLRESQPVFREDRRLFFHELVLDVEAGVGLVSGETPQVMMSYSDDGGYTWSSEVWASMGKLGQYRHRAVWRRLGQARQRVFRFKVTDPVTTTFLGAYAEIGIGAG